LRRRDCSPRHTTHHFPFLIVPAAHTACHFYSLPSGRGAAAGRAGQRARSPDLPTVVHAPPPYHRLLRNRPSITLFTIPFWLSPPCAFCHAHTHLIPPLTGPSACGQDSGRAGADRGVKGHAGPRQFTSSDGRRLSTLQTEGAQHFFPCAASGGSIPPRRACLPDAFPLTKRTLRTSDARALSHDTITGGGRITVPRISAYAATIVGTISSLDTRLEGHSRCATFILTTFLRRVHDVYWEPWTFQGRMRQDAGA